MKIINNITDKLSDELKEKLEPGSKLSIAAACFSVYAFEELKTQLEGIDALRFIFTSPTFLAEQPEKAQREFYIPRLNREKTLYGSEFEIRLRNEFTQKAISRECAEWVRRKASFKSNVTSELMPGFMTVENAAPCAFAPVNGFTRADLGCERGGNMFSMINEIDAPESAAYRDGKRGYIDSEKKIQIVDDVYKVRTVTDTRDTDGSAVTEVYAEAEFYDLTFSVRKEERTFEAEYPETAMAYALEGTEWSVGTVTMRTQRTWTSRSKNALSILRNIADLHGGDLVFDCPNRLVHLLTVNGKDSGALFAYKKNMKSIQRVVDTRELVTRLYAVGAEGMTFADINGGRPYVEDFTYTDEVRISTLDCSSFTNPYQMKEYTEMRLADYAKPTISYVLNAMDLSVLTGYEHEAWELGDYVRVEDKELGLSVTTRIVRREYNLQEPWNTVLELSTTLKNLGSSASEWDNAADSLEGTSMVSNNDIREMVPFNLLRNSRADDGLAYWVSSGFEADSENGASGTASFKAEGVAGMTKSLSQTVYPANRSSYTLSAQIGSEDLEKLSETSQVGIEVVIEYEDGSTESRFIDLY